MYRQYDGLFYIIRINLKKLITGHNQPLLGVKDLSIYYAYINYIFLSPL